MISRSSARGRSSEVVDALAGGRAEETAQDESQATYAPKIEKSDGIVNWSRSAREIHNQIRGLHPWPHAFTDLEGERTILLKSTVEDDASSEIAPEPFSMRVATGFSSAQAVASCNC